MLKGLQIKLSPPRQDAPETAVPELCADPVRSGFVLLLSGPLLSLPPCAQNTGLGTPEMRVIHAGLVIGDGDEGGGWASILDELIQHLLVVDGEVVHVLWGERESVRGSRPPSPLGPGAPLPQPGEAHSLVQKQL